MSNIQSGPVPLNGDYNPSYPSYRHKSARTKARVTEISAGLFLAGIAAVCIYQLQGPKPILPHSPLHKEFNAALTQNPKLRSPGDEADVTILGKPGHATLQPLADKRCLNYELVLDEKASRIKGCKMTSGETRYLVLRQ